MSALELPALQEAHEPPEAGGLARDSVRLLVADRADGTIEHGTFADLPHFLTPGDLVVVNTSATLAAALPAVRQDGCELELRLSTPMEGNDPERYWIVELRARRLALRRRSVGDASPCRAAGRRRSSRRTPACGSGSHTSISRARCSTLPRRARRADPLRLRPAQLAAATYQNVYAVEPGSAEMPSAGRPFTAELITRLVAGGVLVAPIVLHTGVSSQERHERPYAERYRVPATTARLVNAVHALGRSRDRDGDDRRPRARDGCACRTESSHAREGWTNLVVTPERGVRAVDGLITGLHELESSHLDMLRALAGDAARDVAYNAALEHGYRWHEFGDSQLILGARTAA